MIIPYYLSDHRSIAIGESTDLIEFVTYDVKYVS